MRFISHRQAIRRDVEQAFDRAVEETVGDAKENAPVSRSAGLKLNMGSIQGGLRGSITSRRLSSGKDELKAVVGSGLVYAAQREFGGPIVPVRARMLSWVDPVTGERRFAKRVNQSPGGISNGRKPWLRPAGERFGDNMADHLRRGRFGR